MGKRGRGFHFPLRIFFSFCNKGGFCKKPLKAPITHSKLKLTKKIKAIISIKLSLYMKVLTQELDSFIHLKYYLLDLLEPEALTKEAYDAYDKNGNGFDKIMHVVLVHRALQLSKQKHKRVQRHLSFLRHSGKSYVVRVCSIFKLVCIDVQKFKLIIL